PGATLAAKDNILLSAEAQLVAQARGGVGVVTPKQYAVFSKGPASTISGSSMIVGSKGQLLITTGTVGNSPRPLDLEDPAATVQTLNSLATHYRVDSIQTNLFEFLHGRLLHEPGTFDSTKTPMAKGLLAGGFAKNQSRSLASLY